MSNEMPDGQRRTSAAPGRRDRGDVDLFHPHHRLECALCFIATSGERLGQYARRDLPGNAPLCFSPATFAFLPAIADDGVPVAVGLVLIVGGDLEREGFIMFERGTAVEADTRNTGNREFDDQHITRLTGWIVTGCTVDGTHHAVGKGLGVEAGSSLCVLIVPEANGVLFHCESFRFEAKQRDERAPFHSLHLPVPTNERNSTQVTCAAGFSAALCPLWVICVRPRRSRPSRNVRFAPKADMGERASICPLRAISGLMHRKKYVHDSITSSARASSGVGTVSASALAVLRLITRSYWLAPVGAGHRVLCLSFRYRVVSAINLSARL